MAKTPNDIVKNILRDNDSDDKLMYSVVARKKIDIADSKIKKVRKNGRNFLVGDYEYKGKKYSAWQITK
jgi:hypothetical protein